MSTLENFIFCPAQRLDSPILFLSHYILRNKTGYYAGLRGITEKSDWNTWVIYMLEAIEVTAQETLDKANNILSAIEKTQKLVKAKAGKIYSKDLIEIIFQHPYCKIKFLEIAGIAKRQTAAAYLQKLEEIGVLKSIKTGRESYYINKNLVKILSK